MGLFGFSIRKVKQGLSATKKALISPLRRLLSRELSDAVIDELEATLIRSDIGVKTTLAMIEHVRAAYKAKEFTRGDQVEAYIKQYLVSRFPDVDRSLKFAASGPTVILVVGINGAGKTTSIAKIAKAMTDEKKRVMLAACDTFRAAAVQQLTIWSQRLGVEIVAGQMGGDPAAVAFDAAQAAAAREYDVLIVDTAGRLHTQKHLMDQLAKIRRSIERHIPGAPHEVILVLDATTGQNAISQAQIFKETVDVSGVFLAKLDGTAKGGIVVAIREQLGIPVKFIGVGETPDDVEPFEPEKFVEALFAE